jgi:ornithine--oxo-acid transaminase
MIEIMRGVWNKLLVYEKKFGAQNYKPMNVLLNRGEGIYLYDITGRKYFDFLSSYSSVNQGHCHPRLVKKMKRQCETLTLCSRAFQSEKLCEFYHYMNRMFKYDRCLPMNTGVEAGETAIKLARLWGYKHKNIPENKAEIVVAKRNFWGRSLAAVSSSTDPLCYKNFGPYLPGFKFVDYNDTGELEYLFQNNPNIAAFMVEPIQGEAGIKIPDKDYLKNVKVLCELYNVLLICDEVQTGLGRTGKMFASEEIKPDMLVLGKALSGGMMPISCVLGSNEVMELIEPGSHGSTFGGNPLAMAIAPEAINVIIRENLISNAEQQGKVFRDTLKVYVDRGVLKDVRGQGLLNAIEFNTNEEAENAVNNFQKQGLLTKVTRDGIVRMCPPLTITSCQMKHALDIIKSSL